MYAGKDIKSSYTTQRNGTGLRVRTKCVGLYKIHLVANYKFMYYYNEHNFVLFTFRTHLDKMKILYFLGVFSCFVLSGAEDVTEFCEEKCKEVCVPCHEPITCTQNQTDCGLGKPDPAFGGVCPPHSICVPSNMNCKAS